MVRESGVGQEEEKGAWVEIFVVGEGGWERLGVKWHGGFEGEKR